jgi:hypothetical protein
MNQSRGYSGETISIERRHHAWTRQLIWEYELICEHYKIPLRKPLLRIENSSHYWGQYDPNRRMITINQKLIEAYPWNDVIEILKHEMAHQIVFELYGQSDSTHGQWFQRACKTLRVEPWAIRATGDISDRLKPETDSPLSDNEQFLLRRAEKLLALSQSPNEHESMLAMQRLRDLAEGHNLDKLRHRQDNHYSYRVIRHYKKRVPQHQSHIANILQQHFFVDIVFSTEYDAQRLASYKTMEILGTQDNIRMAEYVYYYLWNQLPLMWKVQQRKGLKGQSAKRAYYLGILESVDERLRKVTAQRSTKSTGFNRSSRGLTRIEGQHLKIARQELDAYVKRRHPRLRTRHWRSDHNEIASYHKGRHDGQQLDIRPGLTAKPNRSGPKYLPSSTDR